MIEVEHQVVRGGFTYAMWRQTLEQGLDELTERARKRLSRVREATEARTSAT